jgi:hypothetical protein
MIKTKEIEKLLQEVKEMLLSYDKDITCTERSFVKDFGECFIEVKIRFKG